MKANAKKDQEAEAKMRLKRHQKKVSQLAEAEMTKLEKMLNELVRNVVCIVLFSLLLHPTKRSLTALIIIDMMGRFSTI